LEAVTAAVFSAIRGAGLTVRDADQPDAQTRVVIATKGATSQNLYGELIRIVMHGNAANETAVRVVTRSRMTREHKHDFAPDIFRLLDLTLARRQDSSWASGQSPSRTPVRALRRPSPTQPVTFANVQYVAGMPGFTTPSKGRLVVDGDSIRFEGRGSRLTFAINSGAIDTVIVSTVEGVSLSGTLAITAASVFFPLPAVFAPKTDFLLFVRVVGNGAPYLVSFKTDQKHYVGIGNAIWAVMGTTPGTRPVPRDSDARDSL
jgi:hypothetical protein